MAGTMTYTRAAELRADAYAQMCYAKATGQHAWVHAQRLRVEFLDDYLAANFRAGGRRLTAGEEGAPTTVRPLTEGGPP